MPACIFAQEKIGNKIYKYGEIYHSIEGATLISFESANAKLMSKTLEYFSDAGANIKSLNSVFLPGTEVSEDDFTDMLKKNNIETLILVDIIDSSSAMMSRTTSTAYASINQKKEKSRSSSDSKSTTTIKGKATSTATAVSTTKNVNYITEMSLRLTIFSKKDGFNKPLGVIEGRATNGSPDTTADQIARRIMRRMVKALDEQNAF
jgi:hypothetical protein